MNRASYIDADPKLSVIKYNQMMTFLERFYPFNPGGFTACLGVFSLAAQNPQLLSLERIISTSV